MRYRSDIFVRLLIDYSERIMGQFICTLRALFNQDNGHLGSLPVLSCGTASASAMSALVNELRASGIPFQIQDVDDNTIVQ